MANESTSSSPSGSPSWGLVIVRIAVGAILLHAGWMKVSGGISDELVLSTRDAFAKAPGIVRVWGEHVVLPNPWLFAHLIAWGEFLGGLALFLGALTRIAGIAVFVQFVNFYFAGPESQRFFVLLLAVCGLGCAISHAGRKCGLDVFLADKLPRWMT
jgi:uncharacterized membrane protein YphA (DoxX/SURF4 family)